MSPTSASLTRRQRRVVLGVIALALMMVVSAVSGLNVALPSLARETGATQSELQWIVDAYTMVFAGLLLTAGAIGDRFGRKGVLAAGLVIFGAAAGAAIFASSPGLLIVLRGLMGVGAALVMPVTLSIITTSFPKEERGQAVGVWVGMAGAGAVIGLLGSGVLLEFFEWNSFFALNVVLAALALAGTLTLVPTSRDPHPAPLDAGGALLSLVGVTGLVFGIIEGPERGWTDALVIAGIGGGLAAIVGFVLWELRVERPLLDPRLFRLRGFGTGSLSITIQFFAAFGFFFIVLQYLQFVAGLSPLEAALALLPMPLVMIPLSRQAPKIAGRFGIDRTGALGLVLIAAGLVVISLQGVDLAYGWFAAGVAVFAAGMALAAAPATTAIVASLPAAKQGVASAVNDVSREFGSALGIALLGSVLNESYRSGVEDATAGLPPEVAHRAGESVAFVEQVPADQVGTAAGRLIDAAQQSFVDAAGSAFLVAAGILLVAAAYVALRAPRHDREPAPPAGDATAAEPEKAALAVTA